jgi:hypothetical protein
MQEFDEKAVLMGGEPSVDSAKMPWEHIVLSHRLMATAPASYDYFQDCIDHSARLRELSDKIDISLYTCFWLTG